MHVSVFSGALRYVANGNGGLSGQERTRQFRLREILFCFLNGKVFFLYVDCTGQEIVQKCPDEGDAEKFDQTFDIGIDRRIQDIGGKLEFERQGLKITDEQMANFRAEIMPDYAPAEICGKQVVDVDRRDGVKFYLEGDAWVMMRPSGTEPLVRIYAEAETVDEVHDLLKAAESVVVS